MRTLNSGGAMRGIETEAPASRFFLTESVKKTGVIRTQKPEQERHHGESLPTHTERNAPIAAMRSRFARGTDMLAAPLQAVVGWTDYGERLLLHFKALFSHQKASCFARQQVDAGAVRRSPSGLLQGKPLLFDESVKQTGANPSQESEIESPRHKSGYFSPQFRAFPARLIDINGKNIYNVEKELSGER